MLKAANQVHKLMKQVATAEVKTMNREITKAAQEGLESMQFKHITEAGLALLKQKGYRVRELKHKQYRYLVSWAAPAARKTEKAAPEKS